LEVIMAITQYDPWNRLNQLTREMERVFDRRAVDADESTQSATADWVPAVDIKEEENRFLVVADIPGVDPSDIEITMDNGLLTIRGERSSENTEEREGFKRVERSRGTFYRRFALPDTADVENVTAKGKHGVLEVVIPKQERAQPRRVTVDA
jgi:HSP20 family protein